MAGYIRTLELALTWLFQNTDSEAILNRKLAQEGGSSVLFARDTRESNKLHRSWRRSKFCKDVDKLLSGEQLEPEDGLSMRSEDEDSEPDENLANDDTPVLRLENERSPTAQMVSPQRAFPTQGDTVITQNTMGVNSGSSRPYHIPSPIATVLPPNTWRLLEIYFAYTQSWLPICEKHDILRISYSYPDNGLILSAEDLPNSGDHAELWSILAVAIHQERTVTPDATQDERQEPTRLYNLARSLIPNECGSLEFGHVRALLNLAIINLARGSTETAWLLVGSAVRLLIVVERLSHTAPTRWKHLLAACFMLDSFLSIQLDRRPYLQKSDLDRAGPIEEDGIEEWQPWSGPLRTSTSAFSRTPSLSISSFNKLMDLTAISNMCNLEATSNVPSLSDQLMHQLETWKASLPTKFTYVGDEPRSNPFNPPAILLQIAYLSCAAKLSHLHIHFHLILDLLEQCLTHIGIVGIPSPVLCLLANLKTNQVFDMLDPRLQERLRKFEVDYIQSWSSSSPLNTFPPSQISSYSNIYQVPTPASIQLPIQQSVTRFDDQPRNNRHRESVTLLDDLLPDMNTHLSSNPKDPGTQSMEHEFRRPSVRHRGSAASRDLETFFDDLASLDGAEMVNNQPQFMQNLGFAPDANMADFLALELGQIITSNSSTFRPQNSDPIHLDPVFFDGT